MAWVTGAARQETVPEAVAKATARAHKAKKGKEEMKVFRIKGYGL